MKSVNFGQLIKTDYYRQEYASIRKILGNIKPKSLELCICAYSTRGNNLYKYYWKMRKKA